MSFQSNLQRDEVQEAFKHFYRRGWFGLFSKKPKFKLSSAKEPDSIDWDKIGFSPCQAILKACTVRPLLAITVPFFMLFFYIFNLIFSLLHKYNQVVIIDSALTVGLYFLVKIFSFVTLKMIDSLNSMELSVIKDSHAARKVFITALLKVFYLYMGYIFIIYNIKIAQSLEVALSMEWIYETGDKIVMYLITCSILGPSLEIFKIGYLYSAFTRYRIRQLFAKREEKGVVIDCKYFHLTQGMLNNYFERPEMLMDRKYTLIYSLVFLQFFLAVTAPMLCCLLLLFVISVGAVIDLYLVYTRYRRPKRDMEELADESFRRLILLPKMYTLHFCIPPFTGTPFQRQLEFIFILSLFVLVFVDFDFLLKFFERWVERRLSVGLARTEKRYQDHFSRFLVNYESKYQGVGTKGSWKEG